MKHALASSLPPKPVGHKVNEDQTTPDSRSKTIHCAVEDRQLKQHPLARLVIPPMPEAQRRAFIEDIRRCGKLDRRVVLYERKVLRGWETYTACIELGIEPQFEDFAGTDPIAYLISSDLHRRHLTDTQREAIAAEVLEIWCPQYREEAEKRLHLSKGRGKKVASNGATFSPGKAAEKVSSAFGVSPRQVERAVKLLREAPDKFLTVKSGELTVTEALNAIATECKFATLHQLQQQWTPSDKTQFEERCQIRCDDFVHLLEDPPLPLDHIVTDLPYEKAALPMYDNLAEIAARKLPPHGMLVCLTGSYWLPEILASMCKHLPYRWTMAYVNGAGNGNKTVRGRAQANAFWKPLLVFGSSACGVINADRVTAAPADSFWVSQHPYPADPDAYTQLLRYLQIPPGAVVADPFMGTGVTGVACLRRNIRFIGGDIKYVDLARMRLATEWQRVREVASSDTEGGLGGN